MNAEQLTLFTRRPWEPDAPSSDLERDALARLESADVVLIDTQSSDGRRFRRGVALLREKLWPVVSSSHERGYRLCWQVDALTQLERELYGRAMKLLVLVNRIRQITQRKRVDVVETEWRQAA